MKDTYEQVIILEGTSNISVFLFKYTRTIDMQINALQIHANPSSDHMKRLSHITSSIITEVRHKIKCLFNFKERIMLER